MPNNIIFLLIEDFLIVSYLIFSHFYVNIIPKISNLNKVQVNNISCLIFFSNTSSTISKNLINFEILLLL